MAIPSIGMDPSTINVEIGSRQDKWTLGRLYTWAGDLYRCVKFLDAVTYIKGQMAEWADATLAYVTNDRSGGSAIGTQTAAAGRVCRVMTQNYKGFIQVSGNALLIGDGSVAAGEAVVPHSVDGECDTMAAGEEHQVCGVALNADSTANDSLGVSVMFNARLKGLV